VAFVPLCDDDKGTGNLGTLRYGVRELAPLSERWDAAVRVKAAASRRAEIDGVSPMRAKIFSELFGLVFAFLRKGAGFVLPKSLSRRG
jgi:hypothetical protein